MVRKLLSTFTSAAASTPANVFRSFSSTRHCLRRIRRLPKLSLVTPRRCCFCATRTGAIWTRLSSFVRLPEVIKDKITSFPLPESMKGRDDAYAGFVYAQLNEAEPRFTVGRNVISEEVEHLTSSSGDVFERRKQEL